MSTANNKATKWQQGVGISLLCSLTLAMSACNRSDKNDQEVLTETDKVVVVNDNPVAPAIACNNPLVQERLKQALKNVLNQQSQGLAANYANSVQISLNGSVVSSKVSRVLIDVQNAAIIQDANANGITICQASVSMILPSEDLYQSAQIQSANNQPSLQTRLSQNNLRINNNVLVDDAFTYAIGTQGGQIQARITGQPTLVTLVSEIMAGSTIKSAMDEKMAQQRQVQSNQRRSEAAKNTAPDRAESQAQAVTPLEPIRPVQPVRPVEPVAPVTGNQNSSLQSGGASSIQGNNTQSNSASSVKGNNTQSNSAGSVKGSNSVSPASIVNTKPSAPVKDDGTNLVIIEDNSATY